jgi:hypothetical protein
VQILSLHAARDVAPVLRRHAQFFQYLFGDPDALLPTINQFDRKS